MINKHKVITLILLSGLTYASVHYYFYAQCVKKENERLYGKISNHEYIPLWVKKELGAYNERIIGGE